MKKSIRYTAVLTAVAVILMVCLIAIFAGCEVQPGKSAYEIAVENGFVGTETEWLESLKGIDGTNGADGRDGDSKIDLDTVFRAYLAENPGSSFDEFLSRYLTVQYTDSQYAATKGLLSAVSIVTDKSAGSGVIYSLNAQNGSAFIITNYHVIYNSASKQVAATVNVYLYGKEYADYAIPATVYGGTPDYDIAVLYVESPLLINSIYQAAEFGDSDKVGAGQTAVAVGNADGKGLSATSGVISVDSENITLTSITGTSATSFRVMRVDTAINGGNSGGGLYDGEGRLIGIVNAKTVDDEIENMGYAIPINNAVNVVKNIIANNGSFDRKLLGMTTASDGTSAVYDEQTNKINIVEKIKIQSVNTGSAAAQMGLAAGDEVIRAELSGTQQDTLEVTRNHQLSDLMLKVCAGDTVKITVMRGTETLSFSYTY